MNIDSVLRHLLSDKESLVQYSAGEIVEFEDLKRRMFSLERIEDRFLPDHHYHLVTSKSFEKIKSLADALTVGVYKLGENLLEFEAKHLSVNPKWQHEWQDLITEMPPLLLQAAFLWKKNPIDWTESAEIKSFYTEVLVPNFHHTALPSADNGDLASFGRDNGGFHDLHMHLNGATEIDVLWQDYLTFPEKIYQQLAEGWKHEKVREQLEQESTMFRPLKFRNLLTVARRLRSLLYRITDSQSSHSSEFSLQKILQHLADGYSNMPGDTSTHPFVSMLPGEDPKYAPMALEVLMYTRVMAYVAGNPNDGTVQLFHFYLLILGLCNRLLVQQKHQNGFEQFQKVTLNGLREYTELKYTQRFYQIRGNRLTHLNFLEGRFSPKGNEKDLTEMLNLVIGGWDSMRREDESAGRATPALRLVAHFIKKREGKVRDPQIRYKSLRFDLWQRGLALSHLIKKYDIYRKFVCGVDAASSEFDTPPEVFAPVFRFLRPAISNFTYHAGEDFHHLISGLRAIFEAITFTDMQNGDRIGHAVAAGLSPSQWLKAVGKNLLIARGEWLDNLLFIHHLSSLDEGTFLSPIIRRLEHKIVEYAKEIYDKDYKIEDLVRAWQYRKYEPMLVFASSREQATYKEVFNDEQWKEIEILRIDPQTKEIMEKYHSEAFRIAYEEIILIKANSILNAGLMLSCQRMLLKIMQEKEISIEALPTSNLRIGHHRSFKTYHLWNWLRWHEQDGDVPPVVIGTDDTGIFATNIFNEYANIYNHYTGLGKKSKSYALDIIKMLENNSLKRRFDKP
nr:hypothetical protein [Pedobacter sp. ASV2]